MVYKLNYYELGSISQTLTRQIIDITDLQRRLRNQTWRVGDQSIQADINYFIRSLEHEQNKLVAARDFLNIVLEKTASYDLQAQKMIEKESNPVEQFLDDLAEEGAYGWEFLKDLQKGTSGWADILGFFGATSESELLEKLGENPAFKAIDITADLEKSYQLFNEGKYDELIEMWADKGVKEVFKESGLSSFELEGYYTLGKKFGDNYMESFQLMMEEGVTLDNILESAWNLTGETILEAGFEIAYDKVTDIFPGLDDYYGGDVSGFYDKINGLASDIKETFEIENVWDGIYKIGSNTVSFWGEQCNNLVKSGKGFFKKIGKKLFG